MYFFLAMKPMLVGRWLFLRGMSLQWLSVLLTGLHCWGWQLLQQQKFLTCLRMILLSYIYCSLWLYMSPAVVPSSGGRNSVGVVRSTVQTFDQCLLTTYWKLTGRNVSGMNVCAGEECLLLNLTSSTVVKYVKFLQNPFLKNLVQFAIHCTSTTSEDILGPDLVSVRLLHLKFME